MHSTALPIVHANDEFVQRLAAELRLNGPKPSLERLELATLAECWHADPDRALTIADADCKRFAEARK